MGMSLLRTDERAWRALVIISALLPALILAAPAAAQQQEQPCTIERVTEGADSPEFLTQLNANFRCIQQRLERLGTGGPQTSDKKYGMVRTATVDHLIVALESVRYADDRSRIVSQWTIRNTKQVPTLVMVDRFRSSVSIPGTDKLKPPRIQDLAACDVSYVDSTEQCAGRKPDKWTTIQPGSWNSFRIVTADDLSVSEDRPVSFTIRFIVRTDKKTYISRDVTFDDVPPAKG